MFNSVNFYKFVHITSRTNKPNANNNNKMIKEITSNIIDTTLNSFDITFCIIVNIATYMFIKTINDIKPNIIFTTWRKRLVFLIISIIIGVVYCFNDTDYKVVFNSIILAPVSWSWIFKPICNKLKMDYNKEEKDN